MRGARALDLGDVLHGLEQRYGIVAAHRLAAGGSDQAAQRIGGGSAVERDGSATFGEFDQRRRQRVGFADVGGLFEMVARQIRKLAVVDEHNGAAVLRHQRVGQGQRRVRDVGAADVEGPGHRVAVRQHQRIDAQFGDLQPDALELLGLDLAGKLRAVNGDRADRRGGALGPDRIERVAVHRDQIRAGLGAGRGQPLGCCRSVQPRVKTEAVAGGQMLRQPMFRRRIGQRLDMPGLAVDLLGGLQGVAAIDEHGGFPGQNRRHAGRAGEAGEPGQPLFRRRHIFILLLIGAGNHESGQFAPCQLFAEGGQPGGQRHAAFGLFECLEMGFEHRHSGGWGGSSAVRPT